MSETILLGWKNVLVDGKKVNYTQKAAARLMTEMPDFCELIRVHANNIDNFRVKKEAAQEKN